MNGSEKTITLNDKKADTLAVLLFFITFLPLGILNLVDENSPILTTGSVWYDGILAVGIFLVGMVLHEGLHAVTAIGIGKVPVKDVTFGVDWKNGTLYVHCRKPMKRNAFLVGLATPVLLTGVLPVLLTFFLGGIILLFPCCLLFCGCTYDVVLFARMVKTDKKAYILDNPKALSYRECDENTKEEAFPSDDTKISKKSLLLKSFGILLFIGIFFAVLYGIAKWMVYV